MDLDLLIRLEQTSHVFLHSILTFWLSEPYGNGGGQDTGGCRGRSFEDVDSFCMFLSPADLCQSPFSSFSSAVHRYRFPSPLPPVDLLDALFNLSFLYP